MLQVIDFTGFSYLIPFKGYPFRYHQTFITR